MSYWSNACLEDTIVTMHECMYLKDLMLLCVPVDPAHW